MNRGRLIILLSLIFAIFFAGIGVTFAYYMQRISGWGHSISSSVVSFFFNDMTFGESLSSSTLSLSRGDEAEISLVVRVSSQQKNVVLGYNVNVRLASGENKLARAIECYILDADGESYLGMAADVFAENGHDFSGLLPSNHEFGYYLRLVYSPAAGEEFEETDFCLVATSEIRSLDEADYPYIFAHDEATFLGAIENSANAGKTLYLLDNILLKNDAVLSFPMSIDLNGNKIVSQSDASLMVEFDEASFENGFFDRAMNTQAPGSLDVPINIRTPNGFYAILCELGDEANLEAYSVDSLSFLVQARLDAVQNKIHVLGQSMDLLMGLRAYFDSGTLFCKVKTQYFAGITPDQLFFGIYSDGGEYFFSGESLSIVLAPILTTSVEFALEFSLGLGEQSPKAVAGGVIIVRGNSVGAIAESVLASVPNPISASLMLPKHDVVSGAFISWVIAAEFCDYFDENGVFLRGGYERLTSWEDTEIVIGVKVSLRLEQYSMQESRTVSIAEGLTAARRTQLIYSGAQLILQSDDVSVDILGELSELLPHSGLVSIKIAGGLESNDYLAYTNDIASVEGFSYFTLNLKRIPSVAFVTIEGVDIEFSYQLKSGEIISHIETKNITIMGTLAEFEISDSGIAIQSQLENNLYTKGEASSFAVSGNLKSGAMLDFTVDPQYRAYVTMKNDVYVSVSIDELESNQLGNEGIFYARLENGFYAPFSTTMLFDADGKESADGEFFALTIFDGDKKTKMLLKSDEIFARFEVFLRTAVVSVLFDFVPHVNTTAIIRAGIFEEVNSGDRAGERIFKTDLDGEISFRFTLSVMGILHNRAQEIADYYVYLELLRYFDGAVNGRKNGYIERDEAAALPALLTENEISLGFSMITLSDKGIRSLKGIEYFPEIRGLVLKNNNIIDISYLSSLGRLKYLDLSQNNISNLGGLAYHDELKTLILASNNITTLEPIRYLTNIEVLDVSYNANIWDFSYLGGFERIKSLSVVQSTGIYTNTTDAFYYFALISARSKAFDGIAPQIYINSTASSWNFDIDVMAAALAMSQLVVLKQAYVVLYAPQTYSFDGKTYILNWYTSEDCKLQFHYSDGIYNGTYTITTPVIQENIKISLKILRSGDDTVLATISRTETLTLLPSVIEEVYIEYAEGEFDLAESIVPDPILREKLMTAFNTITEGNATFTDKSGNTVVVSNRYLLSHAEIESLPISRKSFNWSNSGIRSLKGIEYFKSRFDASDGAVSVDISGNKIEDYELLFHLDGITSLTLGGQFYDFSKFVEYSIDENGYFLSAVGGLTRLTELHAYGSYNLSEYDVLKGLFAIYLASGGSVKIFLETADDTKSNFWTPIEDSMSRSAQSLQKVYTFHQLEKVYFLPDKTTELTTTVYDLLLQKVKISGVTVSSSLPQADTITSLPTSHFSSLASGGYLSYNILVGYTQTFNARFTLSTTIGGQTKSFSYDTQLVAEFFDNILVRGINSGKYYDKSPERFVDLGGENYGMPLSAVFSGRSLRSAVMRSISISANYNAVMATKVGDYYFVSVAQLSSWVGGTLFVDGSYFENGSSSMAKNTMVDGLELTGITEARFLRDAVVGDGSSLIKLEKISIASGADFRQLSTVLTELKSLTLGMYFDATGSAVTNQFAYFIFGSSLSLMPNLESFSLHIAKTANAYDFGFLAELASLEENHLSVLFISDNTSSSLLVTDDVVSIISTIYHKSTAEERIFSVSGVEFVPDAQISLVQNIEPVSEYAEFSSLIVDLGLKSGQDSAQTASYFAATQNTEYKAGDKIFLPLSTHSTMLGTDFAFDNVFGRAFYIEWRIYGISSVQTFDGLFNLIGGEVLYENGELFVGLKPNLATASVDGHMILEVKSADYYCAIRGSVGVGYFAVAKNGDSYGYVLSESSMSRQLSTEAAPSINFVYPVYINSITRSLSGYISYSKFVDPVFRHYLFIGAIGSYETNGTVGYGVGYNGMQPANLRNLSFSIPTLNSTLRGYQAVLSNYRSDYSNANNNVQPVMGAIYNFPLYIYSIEGVENLTALNFFSHGNGHITRLPSVWVNSTITDLRLNAQNITDFSVLKDLSGLKYLYIHSNPIRKIFKPTNLVYLYLYNSPQLTVDTLEPLRGNTSITALHLYGCPALYNDSERLIELLSTLGGLTGDTSLRMDSVGGKNNSTALLSVIRGSNDIGNIISGGIEIENINKVFSAGGFTAKIIDYFAKAADFFSDGSLLPLEIRDSTQTLAKIPVRISNSSAPSYTMNGKTCEYFDPSLWAFFATNYKSGQLAFDLPPATLSITTNIELKSLKGLEFLQASTTTLTINSNPLFELWSADPKGLRTINISNAALTERTLYNAFSLAPDIKNINIRNTNGIDFMHEFETNKSLYKLFESRTQKLEQLSFDVSANLSYSGAKNWADYFVKLYSSEGWYDQMATSLGICCLTYLTSWNSTSYHNSYNTGNMLATFKYYAAFNNSRLIALRTTVGYITTANEILSSLETRVSALNLYSSGGKRNLFSEQTISSTSLSSGAITLSVNYSDILSSNGRLEVSLPNALNYFGKTASVSWAGVGVLNVQTMSIYSQMQLPSGCITSDGRLTFDFEYSSGTLKFFGVQVPSAIVSNNSFAFRISVTSDFFSGISRTYTISFIVKNIIEASNEVYDYGYYIQLEDGADPVLAADYFSSPSLLYYFFEGLTGSSDLKSSYTRSDGVILLNTITNQKRLSFAGTVNLGTTSGYPVTSLEGIELFPSTTRLIINSASVVLSLAPIQTLSLVDFQMYNSTAHAFEGEGTYTSVQIFDFSPLIAGSRHTLTSFRYGYMYTPLGDLSFLLSFENLSSVMLANGTISWYSYYLNTPSFRYILAAFKNRGQDVTFSSLSAIKQPNAEESGAAQILSLIESNSSFEYLDGYRLNVKDEATSEGLYLNGIINKDGRLYLAEYNEAFGDSSVQIEKLSELDAGFDKLSFNNKYTIFFGEGFTGEDGTIFHRGQQSISKEALNKLLKETEFISLYASGGISVGVKINLPINSATRENLAKIVCRVTTTEITFERMLTITKS